MKHSEFFQQHPRCTQEGRHLFNTMSRAQLSLNSQPMYMRLKAVEGDRLALRELILHSHGRPTLHNFILGDNGRPIRN